MLLLLLLVSIAFADPLYGTVYYSNLEPAKDIVLTINSTPRQVYVSKTGSFFFDVPPGNYVITVRDGSKEVKEAVTVNSTTIHDIVLPYSPFPYHFLLPLLPIPFLFLKRRKKISDSAKAAMDLIRKEGRMKQKDLRRELGLSEAKVSMIVSELEEAGMVKKIRKGRENIIISMR